MSFSSDVKKELSQVTPEKPCCELSELCGLYAQMGRLTFLGSGRTSVQLTGESYAACTRAFRLLTHTLHQKPQIHFVTNTHFGGRRKCVLTLGPNGSPVLLKALGMMDEEGTLRSFTPRLTITRACCMKAYLRGAMIGGGTMIHPQQGYHLEIPCPDSDTQAMLAKCMQRAGLPIRIGSRRGEAYLYLKTSEQVTTFLTVVGAHRSVMEIENVLVKRQVMGNINRAINCDRANVRRAVTASIRQQQAMERLEKEGLIPALPPSLQEIVTARLEHPGLSLEQLGEQMDPPLSKSAVNHRMRRLMQYLDEFPDKTTESTQEE